MEQLACRDGLLQSCRLGYRPTVQHHRVGKVLLFMGTAAAIMSQP
jgi:hypothetical protein